MSVLQSICSILEHRVFIIDLRKIIELRGNIKLLWAKAHLGNIGNKKAESLVKKATRKTEIEDYFYHTNKWIKRK